MNHTLSVLVLISASFSLGNWSKMLAAAFDGTKLIEQTRSAQVPTQERGGSISTDAHRSKSINSRPETAPLLARINCSAFAFHPSALAWGPYAVLCTAVFKFLHKLCAHYHVLSIQGPDRVAIRRVQCISSHPPHRTHFAAFLLHSRYFKPKPPPQADLFA